MSRWIASKGVQPRTRAEKVFVKFRCGLVSKEPFRVSTTRWTFTGHDFDVLAYFAFEEEREDRAA